MFKEKSVNFFISLLETLVNEGKASFKKAYKILS